MTKQPRKPIKWVGSAKRDLDAMPEDVKDMFGHAIDLAQAGGKHPDAKVMTGGWFGRRVGGGRGFSWRHLPRCLYGQACRMDLRPALFSEEVQKRNQNTQGRS